jgi:cation diffusion facilitator CzcD-associated flavoprotein CzcO
VEVDAPNGRFRLTCRFLYMSSGYYDYDAGYTPDLPGLGDYSGRLVHPQHWPDDLDVTGKRVVVIGSGATAVTLIPALARTAAHVTMLQRSPTYIVARPAEDGFARKAHRWLPTRAADGAIRWKSILLGIAVFSYSRRRPDRMKQLIMKGVRAQLPENYEIERDFEPSYKPWDQRICLVPDADLFTAIKSGKAEVVTDRIARFTSAGIALQSGRQLAADVVVTATGLVVKLFGGVAIRINGAPMNSADRVIYKGQMLDGVPNFAFAFGYTNASWTLKCDLTARWVCRMLDHLDQHGHRACAPVLRDSAIVPEPMLTFTSGYIERAAAVMPKQGSAAPWRVHQNYLADLSVMRLGRIDDGVLEFS